MEIKRRGGDGHRPQRLAMAFGLRVLVLVGIRNATEESNATKKADGRKPGITPYFAQLAVTGTRAVVTASPPQAHARPRARVHRSCCHRSCVACNDNVGGSDSSELGPGLLRVADHEVLRCGSNDVCEELGIVVAVGIDR